MFQQAYLIRYYSAAGWPIQAPPLGLSGAILRSVMVSGVAQRRSRIHLVVVFAFAFDSLLPCLR